MASSFVSRGDCLLRPGDFVRSLTVSKPNGSLDVSQMRRRQRRSVSRSSPSQHYASTPSRDSEVGAAARGAPDRSAPAVLYDADLSSVEAWWVSITKGTWLEEKEESIRIGVVESTDFASKTARVVVWMEGDRCLVDFPRKPVETFRFERLEKLSAHEFNAVCRKRFQHEMAHHLKLRGEGYDESAPLALIAYNNRVISDLIGKIDTTAKLSLKDIKVRRPRGPGDLIRSPIPPMVPVEDPLANARAELEALQGTGGPVKKGKRRAESALNNSKASDEHVVQGALRFVSSRSNPIDSRISGGTSATPPPGSFVETVVEEEKLRLQNSVRVASASVVQHGRPRALQPLVPDRYFPPNVGNGERTFLSQGDEDDDIGVREILCVLVDIRSANVLLFRPSKNSDPPFAARLAYVTLWSEAPAANALRALVGAELRVLPKYRDHHGVAVCEVFFQKECLIQRLLADGFAMLMVSALEEPGTLLSSSAASLLQASPAPRERLVPLRAAQESAMASRRGLWAVAEHRAHNTEPLLDLAGGVEGVGQERLPPLFQLYEASSGFHSKLTDMLRP